MSARLARCLPFALTLLLTGCMSGFGTRMPGGVDPVPGAAAKSGGLAGLVGNSSVISAEEAELRDIQRRPTAIAFPARVGVLFYEFSDPLKREDHQAAVEKLGRELLATGLVSTASEIPSNLVRPGDSLDALRKLAARFQVDVLLLVSGTHEFVRAADQPAPGLFGGAGPTNYDARSTVTGLAIGVYSGTFLTPFQVVGRVGPVAVDTQAADRAAQQYAHEKAAHEAALATLKERFQQALAQAKATQDAAPPVIPTPTPSAAPSADPSASPSAAPSASPSATPSA